AGNHPPSERFIQQASSPIWLKAHPQVPAQQPVLLFQRQERVKPVQQHQYLFLQYYLPNDFG
ncbi:MAG: hypothetical protein VX964_00170, partial [Verrucomicrobiota bacterium]|nr:hypothetical protein [Verrucomicrobiota bacterium]